MNKTLRVLIVEDSLDDTDLLLWELKRSGYEVIYERVDHAETMVAALERKPWDIIISDHAMPSFSAPEALTILQKSGRDLPFIILSGYIGEETAVSAMKAGAHDYILKGKLARLIPAIERELREADIRRARRQADEELRIAHDELETRVCERTADLMQANRQLHALMQERHRLENELLETAENERKRIGFDLHDDLSQKLLGLSFMIKGLENKLAEKNLPEAASAAQITTVIDQVINHTHDLAHHFSTLDIQGTDLHQLLAELATNVRKMFQISFRVTYRGGQTPVTGNAAMQLYKIAQEATSNAIKHGKAKQVAVCVSTLPNSLVLTIKNVGLPFPENRDPKRMGLRIMNYRASIIGASVKVRAHRPSGTIVTCTLPLNGDNKKNPTASTSEDKVAESEPILADPQPA